MKHDPGPYFLRLNYISGVNPHTMQISVKNWTPPSAGHVTGQFEKQDGSLIDASTGVLAFIAPLLPFWTNGTTFASWQLFSKPTPTDIPIQVMGLTLTGQAGSASPPFIEEATQMTINYRTTGYNLAKIVLLDYAEDVSFQKITAVPATGPLADLATYLNGATAIVTGRDGNFFGSFISATRKLNDKLRKEYRQA